MRKEKDPFDKIKKLLKNPLINKPELYRILDMSRGTFYDKLKGDNGARFTEPQQKIISKELKKLSRSLLKLTNGIYQKKKL